MRLTHIQHQKTEDDDEEEEDTYSLIKYKIFTHEQFVYACRNDILY